jgi:hypothetical protein
MPADHALRQTSLLLSLLLVCGGFFLPVQPVAGQSEDRITVEELKGKLDRREPVLILDARSGNAYLGSQVRLPGALHLPADRLESSLDKLPRSKEIVVYCA